MLDHIISPPSAAEQECEGCGLKGGKEYVRVRTTNGGLLLCRQCLDDINRKNPELPQLRAALDDAQARADAAEKHRRDAVSELRAVEETLADVTLALDRVKAPAFTSLPARVHLLADQRAAEKTRADAAEQERDRMAQLHDEACWNAATLREALSRFVAFVNDDVSHPWPALLDVKYAAEAALSRPAGAATERLRALEEVAEFGRPIADAMGDLENVERLALWFCQKPVQGLLPLEIARRFRNALARLDALKSPVEGGGE